MIAMVIGTIESSEDNDIILAFYSKYKMLLYREAWRYLSQKEDVEDVVYESLTRIIEHIGKFRTMGEQQRIQYAKVVVRNISYVLTRRASYFSMIPYENVDVNALVDEENMPDLVVLRKMQRSQMRTVWAALPVEDRLLLEQKYILGWSDKELASALNVQTQSVRMLLTRAKRRVMKQLEMNGIRISEWL